MLVLVSGQVGCDRQVFAAISLLFCAGRPFWTIRLSITVLNIQELCEIKIREATKPFFFLLPFLAVRILDFQPPHTFMKKRRL